MTSDTSTPCLAVIQDNGSTVVVLDSTGEARTFTLSDGTDKQICFVTHIPNVDDLLTPCFDEDGKHGEPEESCFCGREEPHIHAHYHDPNGLCKPAGCGSKSADHRLTSVGKLTLLPANDSNVSLPVTDRLPKQCNGEELIDRLAKHADVHGADSHHLASKKKLYAVKHGDHTDHFVLATGPSGDHLHLEHSFCEDCCFDDIHGTMTRVAIRTLEETKRRLLFFRVPDRPFHLLHFLNDHNVDVSKADLAAIQPKNGCGHDHSHGHSHAQGGSCGSSKPSKPKAAKPASSCAKGCCGGGGNKKTMPKPPPSHDHGHQHSHGHSHSHGAACCGHAMSSQGFASSFLPSEIVMDPIDKTGNVVRTTIACSAICCSSEVPMINAIMEPLHKRGMKKMMITVPLKLVTVDHDPKQLTAREMEDLLNASGFGATIKRDGGAANNMGPAAGKKAGGMGRSQFHVSQICCASEIPAIHSIVAPLVGVTDVSINVTTKMVYVDHELSTVSAQDICNALNDEAFGATIVKDAGANAVTTGIPAFVQSKIQVTKGDLPSPTLETIFGGFDKAHLQSFDMNGPVIGLKHSPLSLPLHRMLRCIAEETQEFEFQILTDGAEAVAWDFPLLEESNLAEPDQAEMPKPKTDILLAGIFWLISLLSIFEGPLKDLKYFALLSVAFGIPVTAKKAYHTLKRFNFDTNVLTCFAAFGAIGLGDFTEAAAVTFLFGISEFLETLATSRARNALSAIVQLRPEFAYLVHPVTKAHLIVPAASVPVGAIVSVKTGDKIPCDGIVLEGESAVNEASLTGESRPVRKGPKSKVSGGTINCGLNHLMVLTTSTADDSAVARLIQLVEEAQANRSSTEMLVDEFAKVYTPIVVLAGLCMCTIPWAFGAEIGKQWMHNGLVLIVVGCPCSLVISTPVTYVAGLAATAQRGIVIKGGAHLETLGRLSTICFDKTGTLTQGSYALVQVMLVGDSFTRKQVLEYLMLMEERANHPLGLAIVDGARNEGVELPKGKTVKNHTFIAGEGLTGEIDGKEVLVGNQRMFKRKGLFDSLPEDVDNTVYNWERMAHTAGFMSIEGHGIVCAYCVADIVRPEATEVVYELEQMGIAVHMLTGDNRDAARAVGQMVGLKEEGINSELFPEDKLRLISSFKGEQAAKSVLSSNPCSKRQGTVMMVGDGVNDAPALAAANIGVAMGVGAALAMETADVTLLDSNLKKLLYSVQMGRKVLGKIQQNVIFSLALKAVVLVLAVMGKVELWLAIATDVGGMLCVTVNGMLLLPMSHKIDEETMGEVGNVSYRSQHKSDGNNTFRTQHTDSDGGRDYGGNDGGAKEDTGLMDIFIKYGTEVNDGYDTFEKEDESTALLV